MLYKHKPEKLPYNVGAPSSARPTPPGVFLILILLVENSTKGSKSIRELAYQKILQVDHIDGDRDNMAPENLITLCPNRHRIKTMNNEDYLNSYDKAT